jgi:hypothetical protein
MNSRTFIIVVSLAVFIAALFVVLKKNGELRALEAERANIERRIASDAGAHRELEARLASAEKARAAAGSAKATARPAPASPTVTAAKSPPPPGFNPMEAIMKDPVLQNYYLASQRATLTRTYGPLFRRLGLDAGQVSKLQDIMIRRAEQTMDLQAAAQSQGLAPNGPELARLRKQADDETQKAAAELLGPANYAEFQNYERSSSIMPVVQNLVGASVLEGIPLSAVQAETVTKILADSAPGYHTGGAANFSDVDWTAADRQLANVLTPEQLKLFQQIEPMGGGPSRFGARLSTTFDAAIKSEKRDVAGTGPKAPGH